MQRTEVVSTSVASLGYDAATCTLEVEFRSGAVYQYRRVPYIVARQLASAESIGAFFAKRVRSVYGYDRVE